MGEHTELGGETPVQVTRYTELAGEGKKKRGPAVDPNSKKRETIYLKPRDWQFFAQWQTAEEVAAGKFGEALARAADDLARYLPHGPGKARERGAGGLFLNSDGKNAPPRVKRATLEARIRELEARVAELEGE